MKTSYELANLDIDTVSKMSVKELRTVVSALASTANKRLKRLEKTEMGRESPAYRSAMKRSYTGAKGGKFGTAGKNINQLRNEYKAVSSFINFKTSSVQKWEEYRKKIYSELGGEPFTSVEQEKAFWSTYRRLEEVYPELKNKDKRGIFDSTRVQTLLYDVVNQRKYDTTGEWLEIINRRLQSDYEKMQREFTGGVDEDFFDLR